MDFQQEQSASLSEILTRLKSAFARYWFLGIPPAVAVSLLVACIAFKLPSYYTSSFQVYIQGKQIESSLLNNDQRDTENFDPLIQELKSRPRLLTIIQKHNVYPQFKGYSQQDQALEKFRKAYIISPVKTVSNRDEAPKIFQVTFSHSDPNKVFQVTNDIKDLFIQESMINVRSEFRGQEEFFRTQAKDIEKRIEANEKKRQEYIEKNPDKLPRSREKAIQEIKEAKSQIAANERRIQGNILRISNLKTERELTVRDPSTSGSGGEPGSSFAADPNANLQQLKQALRVLQGKYSAKHPQVISTKQRIRDLERRIRSGEIKAPTQDSGLYSNTRESRAISRRINNLEVENQSLASENKGLKAALKQLEDDLVSIPVKEKELLDIEREYELLNDQYENIMLDLQKAELELDLIQSQRGTRFKVIEPPAKPQRPAGPPRFMIFVGGIGAGIAIALCIPLAFFYLNSSIKFKKEAERVLSAPVIGMIPPLKTPTAASQKRKILTTSVFTSGATLLIGIIVIFTAL